MNLRHCPSFLAEGPGGEHLMVFVPAECLLVAVLTRDSAEDLTAPVERLRRMDSSGVLAADPANFQIPLESVREVIHLPSAGPFEIEVRLTAGKPVRFRFEAPADRDTVFTDLGQLLGERIPFYRQPPSRWLQAATPLALAAICAAIGIGAYLYFTQYEVDRAVGRRLPRLHIAVSTVYETLRKEGILTVCLGLAALLGLWGGTRFAMPRRRQLTAGPEAERLDSG